LLREINDHGLTRGLTNLPQASNDELAHQPSEIGGKNNRNWKEGEAQKSGDHKRLSPHLICQLRGGNVDKE
jgi:hypothetical protein